MTVKYEIFDDSQQLESTSSATKSETQSEVTLQIPKYSLGSNQSYSVLVTAEDSTNPLIVNTLRVSIFVELSEMLVFIEGGNRQSGYESALEVRGIAKDLDVVESQQTSGITYAWECQDMMNNGDPCKNIKDEVIVLAQSQLVQ